MGLKSTEPFFRTEPIAQPAPGADWSIVAPGRGYWLLLSVFARLVTSVAAPTRQPIATVDDQSTTYFKLPLGAAVAASLTTEYCGFQGSPVSAIAGGPVLFPLPRAGLLLPPGARFRITTIGLDAADQWSNIAAWIQEYPVGASVAYYPGENVIRSDEGE